MLGRFSFKWEVLHFNIWQKTVHVNVTVVVKFLGEFFRQKFVMLRWKIA